MKRFTREEMRAYWEQRTSRTAPLDLDRDPDVLDNVLHYGVPLWLNEYYALYQKVAYQKLFYHLPPAQSGARALDVGCGAGRWCRFLAKHGYRTTGIDLQQELIDLNRERNPEIEFFCTSMQEFVPEKPFDLVSSVTVVQHNPFFDQQAIIQKIKTITKPGGHALFLENVRDQEPHVFANSVSEWKSKFRRAGFELIAIQRYDYNFFTRSYLAFAQSLVSLLRRQRSKGVDKTKEPFGDKGRKISSLRSSLRSINFGIIRVTIKIDSLLEPIFMHYNVQLFPTVHCAFLLRSE